MVDFGKDIEIFDFFKIPSIELTNASLINTLMELDRHVYISLGAHNEEEINTNPRARSAKLRIAERNE